MRISTNYALHLIISIMIATFVINSFCLASTRLTRAETGAGWSIDVYTQQQPFSGVGQDQPSDSYPPDSTVMLYANVTYNDFPVQNIPVSFQVSGPPNNVFNISLSLAAVTNDTGIAETQFTIPSIGNDTETAIFGVWTIDAYTENANDSLTFTVGWLIQIESATTESIDPPQGGYLRLQISLDNIAMTPKDVTLFISFYDSSATLINGSETELLIDPGITDLNFTFSIPRSAQVGTGVANVSVYDPHGVLYGPGASSSFSITLLGDLNNDGKVDMIDVAIAAKAFGTKPGDARWNAVVDVNKDGQIDMRDIALIAKNFGTFA